MVYKAKNRVEDQLASSFAHGTDTSLTVNDASDFDSGGGYILVYDNSEYAQYEYTGVSSNDLTGLTQSNVTEVKESTSSCTFAVGSAVIVVPGADYINDIVDIITDSDEDTRVTVEESADEDIVRIYANGTEIINFDDS